jgi:small acid-soluble spore protein F (minor alpha/beta-type SASP)
MSKKNVKHPRSIKYEIAEELGLMDKVMKYGWGGLTAQETGRIGGLVTQRKSTKKTKSS